MTNLYDIPILDKDGKSINLFKYKGQVLLIVNVASQCGLSTQYKQLEKLQQDYAKDGFSVLGFPCNQFLNQEPKTNQEIQVFASSCYRVTFPIFAKIDVRGKKQSKLYQYLQKHIQHKIWGCFIPWNFTKILVGRDGQIIKRFWPITSWKKIRQYIICELKA